MVITAKKCTTGKVFKAALEWRKRSRGPPLRRRIAHRAWRIASARSWDQGLLTTDYRTEIETGSSAYALRSALSALLLGSGRGIVLYSFLRISLLFRSIFESLRGLPFLSGWRDSSNPSSEVKPSSPSKTSLSRFLSMVLNSPA